MKRKLLLTLIVAIFSATLYAQPAGWLYNAEILATNSNSTALYNYQMALVIDTKSLIEAGKMKPDASDLRFGTPCTGAKLYDYFIDSGVNTPATLVYVKLDTMLSHGTVDFYMFYGNPNATSASTLSIFNGPFTVTNQQTPAYGIQNYSPSFSPEEYGLYFSVNQPVFVTALGKYTPSAGSHATAIYNNTTGTLLAQTTVSGAADQWDYAQLSSPVSLLPGSTYTTAIFFPLGSSYYYDYQTVPDFNPALNNLGYSDYYGPSSLTIPYADPYYDFEGFADMQFYTGTAAAITPTYAFGVQGGPGFSVQPVSSLSICPNSNGTLTTQSQGNNPTYVWQVNTGNGWTNISNNSNYSGVHTSTLSLNNIPPSMNGYQYRANVTSSCGSGYSNISTLSVPSSYEVPFASIFGPNPACQNINSFYTVFTNIVNPTYQWSLNGNVVSTDSFYAFHPTSGDQLYCVLTAPANAGQGCYTVPEAVTNNLTITTGTNLLPHDSIASNVNNICSSTQANFRCYTDVMGGTFQWMVNGSNVGTNSATYAYIPADGDQVTCLITTPMNGCYSLNSATSQPVVMSVISNINPIFTIAANANYNPGDIVTVYANVLNAGNDYKIAWIINGQFQDSTHNLSTYQYIKGAGQDHINAVLVPLSTPAQGTCYSPVGSNNIVIGTATAVNTVNAAGGIQVYPNPFSTEISVNGLRQGDKVCVYDVMGKKVSEIWNVANDGKQTISIKDLVPGTYFLHVWNNTGATKANVSIQKL